MSGDPFVPALPGPVAPPRFGWRIRSLDDTLDGTAGRTLPRTLNAWHLTLLGIGGIIGTGIFVLTAEAAQKAGPGMMLSFGIAGLVCAVAALCYAELAAMIPVAGSAYTFSYVVFGELAAWLVGWALVLEYAVAASAVAVGWSGYMVGLVDHLFGIAFPAWLAAGPFDGGLINLPAVFISLCVTALLVKGTRESATVNAALVALKIVALVAFIALAVPVARTTSFTPFAPTGATGITAAAASIFFAFVGFDTVSTAAEETKNPQRNLPIGLIGSMAICTALYVFVAIGAIGAGGAQPVFGPSGELLSPGSFALSERCAALSTAASMPLACSKEALAQVLREIGYSGIGNFLGLAAALALPSVVLTMMFGQTRVFFVMARDGLLPKALSRTHARFGTPHVVTILTGAVVTLAAAFFPVGQLADISNSGTLFAFLTVALAVMVMRRRDPDRRRPFRVPFVWLVAPVAAAGCVVLFFVLSPSAQLLLPIWSGLGLLLYLGFGYRHSRVGQTEVARRKAWPERPREKSEPTT